MRGRHRRPSRTASLITTAAAGTAVAGTIAVSALPASASTGPSEAPGAPASAPGSPSPLRAVADSLRASQPRTHTVQDGDTLSKIAASQCGNPADWTGIDAANRDKIKDYNLIYPGQVFILACKIASVPVEAAVTSAAAPRHHQIAATASAPVHQGNVSTAGMGGFQACVIRAESGGNPQIWNHQGYPYWGLYQFGYSTWVAHGGVPADWGHAGAAEQTQVFWNTVHADGGSDWTPSDGCPF